ncbi:Dabb family protein [Georgenia ruanii]|uniref:Dabb family protein n=1 Tax=Georgenia ruanii TaxID=348442 RepID=A0A7J9UWM7_9MICO|nr:Dabb family protein [Georgenia ruanii]MPV89031.1 Dabb family protein [Georgenia ruanii]
MIRHVVMFRWKPDFEESRRREWYDRLLELPGKIDVIRSLSAGPDVLRSGRSWDVVLVADFDSLEDVGVYTDHPDHQPLIALSGAGAAQIASVDFEIPEPPGSIA